MRSLWGNMVSSQDTNSQWAHCYYCMDHSKLTVWAHFVSLLWARWVSSKWACCSFNVSLLWVSCELKFFTGLLLRLLLYSLPLPLSIFLTLTLDVPAHSALTLQVLLLFVVIRLLLPSKGSWLKHAHSKYKKYFQAPLLVLQLVTNRGLMSVPGWTNQHQEGPW